MDTINSYLVAIARSLVLSTEENTHIATSIFTLRSRLSSWFGDSIKKQYQFGSSIRETILPRHGDADSDIDYMVVFDNEFRYKPATMLGQLRRFVENKYSRSEVYQSHPTIVLELSHIKFELVPAYQDYSWSDTYYIPAPASGYIEWMTTNPSEIQNRVKNANNQYNYQIKKLIRLLKYWNALNGKVYSSYKLEEHIASRAFVLCTSLEEFFFDAVRYLPTYGLPQYKIDKVQKLKNKVAEVRKDYYENNFKYRALRELADLLPMP